MGCAPVHYFCTDGCQGDEDFSVRVVHDVDTRALVGVQAEVCAANDSVELRGLRQHWHELCDVVIQQRHIPNIEAEDPRRMELAEPLEEGGVRGVTEPALTC